ncbi:putative repeat protein (TIGR03943 family) [Amycolatopsis lexingtonensis]|uniref:Repeat protein (TIGR03943 family) n=1 Tax=Amycolatopsis lexingtonensis TaxID=218822 RepID=A0ABR9IGV0_9PSEU|nr:TIGR03943 family protein [Amycolatopsis lexingtonensis]MBE1502418.1 putative repeat protein (TIGR03943 family) [Amycolatopsis lexingtonensis]
MKRETQNILLLLLGGALIKIAVNGDYLRYVKPAQQPWIIIGGAVMVALGALAIVRDLLAARADGHAHPAAGGADSAVAADDGHGHAHSARPAWLLLVPVLAVFLVAPPALGADSVIRTEARVPASAAAANAASFPPLPAGDPVPLAVNEFVSRAGWDAAGTLNGRTVSLTGFVVHTEGSTLLARLVISCCAADAFPVTVRLRGGEADHLASDAWIRVTGQVVPGTATRANSYTPDFTPTSLATVPTPKDPYEY